MANNILEWDVGEWVINRFLDFTDGCIGRMTARKCLKLTLDYFGLDAPRLKRPKIKISRTEGTSRYTAGPNEMVIIESHIDSGRAYFEESFHYARAFEMGMVGVGMYKGFSRHVVDEFFGRLGWSIGKTLVEGTSLDYLFENEPEEDHTDPNFLGFLLTKAYQRLQEDGERFARSRNSGEAQKSDEGSSPLMDMPYVVSDLSALSEDLFHQFMGNMLGYMKAELWMQQNPDYFEKAKGLIHKSHYEMQKMLEDIRHPHEDQIAEAVGVSLDWFF